MESLLSAGIVSHLSFLSSEVGDDAEALKRLLRAVEAAVFRAEAPAAGGGGEGGGDEEEQRCAYALATLLLESARTDCEEEHVRRVLMEEYAVDTVPATGIAAAYAVLKARMVAHLLRTGPSCPHVVGIDWRLDYSIASSITGRDLRPLYLVTLKVKDDERSAVRDLTMTCTLEQLQDLLAQVKDAVKQVDRILHASEADTGAAGGGGGGGGSSLERK